MAIDTPVKWYTSSMAGIPEWGATNDNTAPGKLVPVLDAVMVDGFGLVTIDNLSVANNVATATRSAGMPFFPDQVIAVAGASPAALNGEWRVVAVTGSTLTFTTSGISNQTATGTITIKTAPLGWELVFSDTNRRVYRSKSDKSPRSFYRFNDQTSGTVYTTPLGAFTSMSSIDSGTGQWYTEVPSTSQYGIARSYEDLTYTIVGDDRTVHIHNRYRHLYSTLFDIQSFGDFFSFAPVDSENEVVACGAGYNQSSPAYVYNLLNATTYSPTGYAQYQRRIRRGTNGVFGARVYGGTYVGQVLSGESGIVFPNGVGNSLILAETLIREEDNGSHVRGKMRGMYNILNSLPLPLQTAMQVVSGVTGLENRKVGVFRLYANKSCTSQTFVSGQAAIDITGPWD